ncbi:CBS domain containing-hemolysin-like protein [Palleronia aestuarii]|uniref:CBS domain containing-hemolysin-like protein n=1 Tax=Palleronia aestuarii TaxID=568105 RepID=A0A2W7NH83_9RHOB|nr:hemolysin family protein [Palleronia aestuarii]PZX19781.1 CBS domain containing-hemolysin-like protein [Palleronia aestuarii]
MALILVLIVIVAMLLANAFYVAAEFAAVSASRPKLEAQAEDGSTEARYLEETIGDEKRMDRYIACAQVGITFTSLVIGFYGQRALLPYIEPLLEPVLPAGLQGPAVAAPLILIVLSVLQVIFGELFPKSIAVRAPENTAMATSRPMRWSLLLLGPFIALLNGSALFIMRRLGLDKPKETGEEHSHEELRQLIADSLEGGAIERSAHEMMRQVLSFQDRTVSEVMAPRVRIEMMTTELRAGEALRAMLATPFTRFPVIDGDGTDRPVGFVHIRDLHALAREDGEARIDDILRPLQVLPDSLSLAEVWNRLQSENAHLAVIFNEYGVISGLVTLEDLIEEIIGEVVDEFDDEEPRIRHRKDRVVLRGDLPVREINRKFDLGLPEDQADTLSGLVALKLGVEDARRGAGVTVAGTKFRVDSVENGLPRLISFPRTQEMEKT